MERIRQERALGRSRPRRDVLRLAGLVLPALAAPPLRPGCGADPACGPGHRPRGAAPGVPRS
ncbi:hypothetical protein ACFW9X_26735, partial [Streptomyces sp. NPDC059466]